MRVDELMTRRVSVVSPETTLKEVAALLVERRISGVPVCDRDGKVVGVVSERDLLYKELGREERGGGPLAWFATGPAAAAAKANARTAGDTMTSPAVTIEASRRAGAAARLMIDRNVNRLPVVDRRGELVGIISRADLVRAFSRGDREIRREIEDDVLRRSLWVPPETVLVEVDCGEVTLAGTVETRSLAEILPHLVEHVPGVVGVTARLEWRNDDVHRSHRPFAADLP